MNILKYSFENVNIQVIVSTNIELKIVGSYYLSVFEQVYREITKKE